MKSLCSTIFGVPAAEFPHPEADWDGFLHMVENLNNHEPFLWNVKVKSPQRWIVIPKLKAKYQKKGCVIV
jgi:hypothetical protein